MRRTTLTFITAVLLLALAAAACGGTHASPSAQAPSTVDARTGSSTRTTLPTSPTTGHTTTTATPTTTTAPTATTADPPSTATSLSTNAPTVPATITPAYVNTVFATLNHVYGNALRLELQTNSIPAQAAVDLRAIYNDPLYSKEMTIAAQDLAGNRSNVRNPPGDQVTRVLHLISASPTCIFVDTETNVSKVVLNAPTPGYDYYELTPKQPGIDPTGINPTPWALTYDLFFTSPTPPQDQCTSGS
jgi:hypothetical protein